MPLDATEQKLLKSTKFPQEFSQKVDIRKVNIEVIKKWMAERIHGILKTDDDLPVEFAYEVLTDKQQPFPNIKELQIRLTGFLEKDTPAFCKELWDLLLSAQSSPQGVPSQLLEAKKLEIIQQKIDKEKREYEEKKRREEFASRRGRGHDHGRRDNHRDHRDRPTYRQDGRQDRGRRFSSRGHSHRYRSRSRSPLGVDSYVPEARRRSRSPRRRSPAPTRRYRSPRRGGEREKEEAVRSEISSEVG